MHSVRPQGDGSESWVCLLAAATVALALVACATPQSERQAVEAAIPRAEAFLERRGAAIDPLMTYVLARLERRWGLAWPPAQRAAALAVRPASPQRALFARLVDPAAKPDPTAIAAIDNPSDRFILTALYCRELPGATLDVLAPWADRQGADVSHGALALGWLRENGCVTTAESEPLRQAFLAGLRAEASRHPDTDSGIEAMAMLDYLGAADRIEAAWINAVLAAQHDDGGWGERPPDASNDHTTVLALWVLLAVSRPPVTDLPWIPAG